MEDPLSINVWQNEKNLSQDNLLNSNQFIKFGTVYLLKNDFFLQFHCEFCGKHYKNFKDFLNDSLKHILEGWEMNSQILLAKALESSNESPVHSAKNTNALQWQPLENEHVFVSHVHIKDEEEIQKDFPDDIHQINLQNELELLNRKVKKKKPKEQTSCTETFFYESADDEREYPLKPILKSSPFNEADFQKDYPLKPSLKRSSLGGSEVEREYPLKPSLKRSSLSGSDVEKEYPLKPSLKRSSLSGSDGEKEYRLKPSLRRGSSNESDAEKDQPLKSSLKSSSSSNESSHLQREFPLKSSLKSLSSEPSVFEETFEKYTFKPFLKSRSSLNEPDTTLEESFESFDNNPRSSNLEEEVHKKLNQKHRQSPKDIIPKQEKSQNTFNDSISKDIGKEMETASFPFRREEFYCKKCCTSFPTKLTLDFHHCLHNKNILDLLNMEEITEKDILTNDDLNDNNQYDDDGIICLECNKEFNSKSALYMHKKRKHIATTITTTTTKTKDDQETLDENERQRNCKKSSKKFFCFECKKVFNCRMSLRKHYERTHSPEGLEEKKLNAEKREELRKAKEEAKVNQVFSCLYCDKKYNRKNSLRMHMKTIHATPEEIAKRKQEAQKKSQMSKPLDPKDCICPICNKQTSSKSALRSHKHRYHPPNILEKRAQLEALRKEKFQNLKDFNPGNEDEDADDADQFDIDIDAALIEVHFCNLCKKTFANHVTLKNHQRDYHAMGKQRQLLKCDMCEASFKDKTNLNVHRLRHLGTKPHACHYCDKRFTTTTEQKVHEQSHTQKKPYICEICANAYSTSSILKLHKRRHDNERPYACDQCGKRFYANKFLKDHLASHSDERPFQCDQCEKTFTRKKALKQHQKLHSDIFSYRCQYCEKSFQQAAGLYGHVKSIHKNVATLTKHKVATKLIS